MKKIKKKDKVKTKKSLLDSKDIKNKDKTNDKRGKKKKRKWWKKIISLFLILASLGVFLVFAF